jgi:hypothetical protein
MLGVTNRAGTIRQELRPQVNAAGGFLERHVDGVHMDWEAGADSVWVISWENGSEGLLFLCVSDDVELPSARRFAVDCSKAQSSARQNSARLRETQRNCEGSSEKVRRGIASQ